MPNHHVVVGEWSVCVAAQEPRRIYTDIPPVDRRLDLANPLVAATVNKCKKRTTMDGVYLNGACGGCVCKVRLNLESLG